MFPIVLAFEIWGIQLSQNCIILHSDNAAVVHIINKQTCKVPVIMGLVPRLVLACMKYNILFKAEQILGKYNVLLDLLSRLQVERFHLLAPHMDSDQTFIPEHLLAMD